MQKLRICHVTALPSRDARGPVGGVGTYSLALLEMLRAGPLELSAVCNADAAPPPFDLQVVPAWHFGSPLYPRDVTRAVAHLRPDVVHVQQELFLYGPGPIALLFPGLIARLRRRHRVVVTVHGVTTQREIDASLMRGRRSPIPLPLVRGAIVGIFRAIARSGADLVVHGDVLKERLVTLGAPSERVTVIAHPLFATAAAEQTRAQARAALGLDPGKPIALTWGFWNGYKGLDELVRGFERFAQRHPGALLLLGTGPHPQLRHDRAYTAAYQAAMSALSSHSGVRHVGFIDDAALPQFVRAADVSIFAYTKYLAASGPATYALTLESPVLLSSVFPGVAPALRFEPSPDGVDAALERFFADPEPARAAAKALRDSASAQTLLEQYVDLYGRVAAE